MLSLYPKSKNLNITLNCSLIEHLQCGPIELFKVLTSGAYKQYVKNRTEVGFFLGYDIVPKLVNEYFLFPRSVTQYSLLFWIILYILYILDHSVHVQRRSDYQQ